MTTRRQTTKYLAPATALVSLVALGGCALPPMLMFGGATAATVSSQQQRSSENALSDTEIRVKMNVEYSDVSVERFANVSINVIEGRVVLLGYVPDGVTREEAAEIAQSIEGVKKVTNAITVGPRPNVSGYLRDARLSNTVRSRILQDKSLNFVDFSVEVQDAVVHLMGIARSDAELRTAAEIARSVPGVAKVVSHVLLATDPARTQ